MLSCRLIGVELLLFKITLHSVLGKLKKKVTTDKLFFLFSVFLCIFLKNINKQKQQKMQKNASHRLAWTQNPGHSYDRPALCMSAIHRNHQCILFTRRNLSAQSRQR